MQFLDYVIEKFPFRISTIRTDRGISSKPVFTGMSKTRA